MQPWEVTITRSVKPILRAGIGLWTLLLLAISLGLLEALEESTGADEWILGALTIVIVCFWVWSFTTFVARITIVDDIMTLVTAVSSVSYRLIDIDKVRFLSIPVSMFQIMWVRTQFDLVGRIYQYGAQGLDVAKIEREIRQLVNEASVSLPPASERDRSVNFLRG